MLWVGNLLSFVSQIFFLGSLFMLINSMNLTSSLPIYYRRTFLFSTFLLFVAGFFTFFALQHLSIFLFSQTTILSMFVIITGGHISLRTPFPSSLRNMARKLITTLIFVLFFSLCDLEIGYWTLKGRKVSSGLTHQYVIKNFLLHLNMLTLTSNSVFYIKYSLLFSIALIHYLSKKKFISQRKATIIEFGFSFLLLIISYQSSALLNFTLPFLWSLCFLQNVLEAIIPTLLFEYEIYNLLSQENSCEIATCGFILFGVLSNIISICDHFIISKGFKTSNFYPQNPAVESFGIKIINQFSIFLSSTSFSLCGFLKYFLGFAVYILVYSYLKRAQDNPCDLTVDSKRVSQDLFDL